MQSWTLPLGPFMICNHRLIFPWKCCKSTPYFSDSCVHRHYIYQGAYCTCLTPCYYSITVCLCSYLKRGFLCCTNSSLVNAVAGCARVFLMICSYYNTQGWKIKRSAAKKPQDRSGWKNLLWGQEIGERQMEIKCRRQGERYSESKNEARSKA